MSLMGQSTFASPGMWPVQAYVGVHRLACGHKDLYELVQCHIQVPNKPSVIGTYIRL